MWALESIPSVATDSDQEEGEVFAGPKSQRQIEGEAEEWRAAQSKRAGSTFDYEITDHEYTQVAREEVSSLDGGGMAEGSTDRSMMSEGGAQDGFVDARADPDG